MKKSPVKAGTCRVGPVRHPVKPEMSAERPHVTVNPGRARDV